MPATAYQLGGGLSNGSREWIALSIMRIMQPLSWRGQIHKTVLLLGAVSLLNDLSGEIVMAVLPLFIAQLGGGGLIIGLIGGLEEAAKSLLSAFSGLWSDRARTRKGFVFAGYGFTSLMRLLMGFSTTWLHLLFLRMLDRVGKGIRTPARDALIADAVPTATRGINFGFHRMMDTSGAVLGSLCALLLFWVFALDLRSIVIVGGIIALSSLIPLAFVQENSPSGHRHAGPWWGQLTSLSRTFRRALLAMTLFALANFSYMFFLLKVHVAFAPPGTEPSKLSLGLPIAMYVLFNTVYALLAAPAGRLSDRWGRRWVLITGYLLFSMTALGFAWTRDLWPFIGLFVLYGAAYALIESNQRAFAADLAEPLTRGTALGLFHMSLGVGALAGGLVAGALWQTIDPAMAFIYGSVLALLAALALSVDFRPANTVRI